MKIINLIFAFIVLSISEIYAQGTIFINSEIETVPDASTQNWSIAQDNKAYIYIANTNGILFFNGNNWQLITMPNQQPVRYLTKADNDTIYVGGQNEFGYLASN
jgi:hypothetical protein